MATNQECLCCTEIGAVSTKLSELEKDVSCITLHDGFLSVCLDIWVLQNAYFLYRERYGEAEEKTIHE